MKINENIRLLYDFHGFQNVWSISRWRRPRGCHWLIQGLRDVLTPLDQLIVVSFLPVNQPIRNRVSVYQPIRLKRRQEIGQGKDKVQSFKEC